MARKAHRFVLWVALLMAVALVAPACGGTAQQSGKGGGKSAVLVVTCDVEDAEVWVNSRYSRSTAEFRRGLRVAPGSYRIEVRHSGFHSRYFEVDLAAKERRVLDVVLARRFK